MSSPPSSRGGLFGSSGWDRLRDHLPFLRRPQPASSSPAPAPSPSIPPAMSIAGELEESTVEPGIHLHPEFAAVAQSSSKDDIAVLIHLKAPATPAAADEAAIRPPVDLVTVLDVSGSMAGRKLELLKRAMAFVVDHLGPQDRLGIVAFSSSARRVLPLLAMSDQGKQLAADAVAALADGGTTNIAAALTMSADMLTAREFKNPVCSIMLLTDGHDNCTLTAQQPPRSYDALIPAAIAGGERMPVHAFGFGTDHDAAALHTIAEASFGTFSFIDDEEAVQDAFARCIGGLLSVAAQELRVEFSCVDRSLRITAVESGKYAHRVDEDRRAGSIDVGELYAEEERRFLVFVAVPATTEPATRVLRASAVFHDPQRGTVSRFDGEEVAIDRPETAAVVAAPSPQVAWERVRVTATKAMASARDAAERGALAEAAAILEAARAAMTASPAGRAGDPTFVILDSELREMQQRMADRRSYEGYGRSYVLSALSSHSQQRATTRRVHSDDSRSYDTQMIRTMVRQSRASSTATSASETREMPAPAPR